MLESLGLDPRTEKVYRALLQNPTWGVADIAGHLGITTQAVHDDLDVLVDLSLLKTSPKAQSQIRPVSPELGLGALLAQQEIELASRQQQVEENRAAIAGLIEEYRVAHAKGGSFEQLEGLSAVRDRLEELAHKAQYECLSLLPGGPVEGDTMEASRPLDELALSRGVIVRTVFQDSFRNDPATMRYARWLHERGGETRSTPLLPLLMVIIDRTIALVPSDPENGRAGALQTGNPGIVAALSALFDRIWQVGVPFDEPQHKDARQLSAQERALLQLLVNGATDQAAANRLGLSLRTVRRMMSELQQRLGAHSRFQAGALASQHGWV